MQLFDLIITLSDCALQIVILLLRVLAILFVFAFVMENLAFLLLIVIGGPFILGALGGFFGGR